MRRTPILLAACLLAGHAEAKPIRDLSLSPQETLRQPNITRSQQQPWESGVTLQSSQPPAGGLVPPGAPQAASRFMDGYCDPNFRPLAMARGNAMQSCIQNTRQQACQLFYRLPADAQAAIEDSVSCASEAAEAVEDAVPVSARCQDSEKQRLRLAKKYWDNQETAHALVSLPDMVTNPVGNCMGIRE